MTDMLNLLKTQTRTSEMLKHECGSVQVPWRIIPEVEYPTTEDIDIAKRLIRAYRLAVADQHTMFPKNDIWTGIQGNKTYSFLEDEQPANVSALAKILCNMSTSELTTGFFPSRREYLRLKSDSSYRKFWSTYLKDCLVALADSLGITAVECSEQGNWGKSMQLDINYLIEEIEVKLGTKIDSPISEGGCLKIGDKTLLDEKDISAIYASNAISRINAKSVIEIGAGTGKVAYYCNKLGVSNYSIYDLPLTNIFQGYLLLRSKVHGVALFGEPKGRVNVEPYWKLADADNADLVFNQDSFPEIDSSIVTEYLKTIQKKAKFFLSINQEGQAQGQLVVPQLIANLEAYHREYRFPYWLRKGYVQELYKIQGVS